MRGAPENEPQEPQFPQPRHWMSFRSWRGPPDGLCEALPRARKGSTSATVSRRRPDGQGLRAPQARCGGVAEWLKAHRSPSATVPDGKGFACASSTLRRGGRVVEGARLESVYTGNRIAGSNPAPSASSLTEAKPHGKYTPPFTWMVWPVM